MFALAGQDAHLFDSTIRENLLARPARRDGRRPDAGPRASTSRRMGRVAPTGARDARRRGRHASCRAASGSGSCSPGRCSRARRSCSSTSRRRISTRSPRKPWCATSSLPRTARSVLLVTHRPEGLDLVDEVVELPALTVDDQPSTSRRRARSQSSARVLSPAGGQSARAQPGTSTFAARPDEAPAPLA